jgi:hypothetical protein
MRYSPSKLMLSLAAAGGVGVFSNAVVANTITIVPNAAFAGDGWLGHSETAIFPPLVPPVAPATAFTTVNPDRHRGIAFNEATGHILVAGRHDGTANVTAGVWVFDSGGTFLDQLSVTDVTGGTFAINHIVAAADGAIYAANLQSPLGTNPFKVYRWADEAASVLSAAAPVAPVVIYESTSVTAGRLGDSFNVTGTGEETRLAAGEGNTAGSGPRNGFAVVRKVNGSWAGTLVGFSATGTPPPAVPLGGDFRLGISFIDADTVIGTQGGAGARFRVANFSPNSSDPAGIALDGSLVTTPIAFGTTVAERPMSYAVVNGVPVLAVLNTATNAVRIYDMSDPYNPSSNAAWTATAATGTPIANSSGLGSVAWDVNGATAKLYVLNSNNGIQSFNVSVTPAVVAPTVTTQPTARAVFARGQTIFTADGAGTPPLAFQWAKDGVDLVGQTSRSLAVNPVIAETGGAYTCRISNTAGEVTSNAATLTVLPSVDTAALTRCWQVPVGTHPAITLLDTQRGMDYDPVNGYVYVISRNTVPPKMYLFSAVDGSEVGELNTAGVAGGLAGFHLNLVKCDDEGNVYAANLVTDGIGYKIYRWSLADITSAAAPTVIYEGTLDLSDPAGTGLAVTSKRLGDSFDVRTVVGATPAETRVQLIAGSRYSNKLALFTFDPPNMPTDPVDIAAVEVIQVTGAVTESFALGLSFGAGNTLWGKSATTPLIEARLDAGVWSQVASYGAPQAVPSNVTAIAVDPTRRLIGGLDTGNSDNIHLFQLDTTVPTPTISVLDQEFFPSDNDNINRTGAMAIHGDKLFVLDTNNVLACYSIGLTPTVAVDASITDVRLTGSGSTLSFDVVGSLNRTYLLQKSTDLAPTASWSADGSVQLDVSPTTVERSIVPGAPRYYYRAKLQPE